MSTLTRDVAPGHQASGKPKKVTSYRTWLFSGGWPRFDGWPAKNIHTDLDAARECGVPKRAASGAMMQGYLAELMVDTVGEEWLRLGVLDLKFTGIVDVDDTVTSRLAVTGKAEEGSMMRVDMDVWCENQRGEKVVVGTATGLFS